MSRFRNDAAFMSAPSGVAVAAHAKVHCAAVAIIPPASAWRPIQSTRCFRDKSFVRWPPHINLLYPFLEDVLDTSAARQCRPDRIAIPFERPGVASFHELALRASRALSRVAPFRVRLERLRTFRHSARSFTVWAAPVPVSGSVSSSDSSLDGGVSAELLEVQRLLAAEFPDCHDLSHDEGRGIDGFVPHLSLGQLRDEGELQALQNTWTPLEFTVDSVQLISRQGYLSPFTIRYHVPLGVDLEDHSAASPSGAVGVAEWHGDRLCADRSDTPTDRTRSVFSRAYLLDVPYVATMANLSAADRSWTAGARGGADGGEEPSMRAAGSLEARYASPALLPKLRASSVRRGGGAIPSGPMGGMDEIAGNSVAISRKRRGSDSDEEQADARPADAGPGSRAAGGHEPAPRSTRLSLEGRPTEEGPGRGVEAGASGSEVVSASGSGGGNLSGASVWWFAYGAAAAAEAAVLGAWETLPAHVLGYRLAFNRRGGRANLVPLPDPACQQQGGGVHQAPHGVLFRLPVERMARLLLAVSDASPLEVVCQPYGSSDLPDQPAVGPLAAVAFSVPPAGCVQLEVPPNAGYLASLEHACETHGIDPGFRNWLATWAMTLAGQSQDASERAGPQSKTAGDGRDQPRGKAFRTGAKKAIAGLPRAVLDW